jgi:hypothetical protein
MDWPNVTASAELAASLAFSRVKRFARAVHSVGLSASALLAFGMV